MSTTSPPSVRAIHTSLTSRPVPSIPPPTQTYIPLAKQILQHRLVRYVFLSSFLSCWVLSTLWSLHLLGGSSLSGGRGSKGLGGSLLTPFKLKTILGAVMVWGVLALPEVVLRKRYLTSKPTKASSPKELVNEARKTKSTKIAVATYVLSALGFLALHIVVEGDPSLNLFVKSKKHPFYLNPRFIYAFFSQIVVALTYAFRAILLNRFTFHFYFTTSSNTANHRLLTFPTFIHSLLTALLLSTLTLPLTSLLFSLSRLILPLLYRLPLLPYVLKPFTAHFLKMTLFSLSRPISSLTHTLSLPLTHFPLTIRALSIAYTTLFTWEIASTLFSASISQPITVSQLVPDPNLILVSGISASSTPAEPPTAADGFPFHYMAYLELRNLASADTSQASAQRSSLFADQKYTPSLWSRLVRESLLLIGRDYQLLVHQGNPPPPPTTVASACAPAAQQTGLPFQATPIKLISQSASAFRPAKESPVRSMVDSLASDGPFARAVESVGDEAEVVVSKVPELFRSVRSAVGSPSRQRHQAQVEGGASGNGSSATVVMATASNGMFSSLVGYMSPHVLMDCAKAEFKKRMEGGMNEIASFTPGWVKDVGKEAQEWWVRERKHKKVEMAVMNKEVDLVVVDVLSRLVCASLTEDTFGVVQRDIPKILEAMVRFLGEVDGWRAQLASSSLSSQNQDQTQLSPAQIREQHELDAAKALLSELSDGLKEGIGRIVRTFGDKLTAFKFPPSVARCLQGFLDYCS